MKKSIFKNQKICLGAFFVLAFWGSGPVAFSQGNGTAGIEQATQEVTSYFDPATTLMYAVGAVLGLIGAVKVYSKWNSGDPDTQKTAASWFGSCVFLVIVATVLRSFFL